MYVMLIILVCRWTFTVVFTVEMVMRIVALGFFLHRYSYLRDAWNWLDFIVVILSFVVNSWFT